MTPAAKVVLAPARTFGFTVKYPDGNTEHAFTRVDADRRARRFIRHADINAVIEWRVS